MLDESKFTYNNNGINNRNKSTKDKVIFTNTQSLNIKQGKVFTRAFTYAGIGFLFLMLFSFGFGAIWEYTFINNISATSTIFYTVLGVSLVLIIISSLCSWIWMKKMLQASVGFSIFCYGFFIIGNSLGFSLFVVLLGQGIVLAVFGLGALFFLVAGLIACSLNAKGIFTINKIIRWLTGIMVVLCLTMLIMIPVFIFTPAANVTWIKWWDFIIYAAFGFIIFLYTIKDIARIKAMSQFADMTANTDSKEIRGLSILAGYMLLVDFVNIIWILLRFAAEASAIRK